MELTALLKHHIKHSDKEGNWYNLNGILDALELLNLINQDDLFYILNESVHINGMYNNEYKEKAIKETEAILKRIDQKINEVI